MLITKLRDMLSFANGQERLSSVWNTAAASLPEPDDYCLD